MRPPSPIEPEGVFEGLRGGAIVFGALVDLGATIVASTLLLAWLAPEVLGGDEAAAAEALARVQALDFFLVANIALGALCTVLGAFVGARRAGRLHVRHGGWVAVASTAFGALLLLAMPPGGEPIADTPFWLEVVGWILILPAGMAGGALARALAPTSPLGPPGLS